MKISNRIGQIPLVGLVGAVILTIVMGLWWTAGHRPSPEDEMRRAVLNRIALPGLKEAEREQKNSISRWSEPVLIIHFWASWCQPCRDEFPSIIQAAALLPGSVRIIAVSKDQDPKAGLEFFQSFKGSEKLESLWDDKNELSQFLGTNKLPETYFLGPERQLIRKIGGTMNWMDPKNLQFLRDLALER